MIKFPGMIMIGAGDRNVGKTEFACSLIRKFSTKQDIIGIKVTTIESAGAGCHRGSEGCGVCSSLKSNFCITEETESRSGKDTCRMLAAGAKKVFWLRVFKDHLEEGAIALQAAVGKDSVCVCESNSLRSVAQPELFFMFKAKGSEKCKPTAERVEKYADRTVLFDGSDFDITLDDIELNDGEWAYKMPAAAVIMAGGESKRMGKDKSTLSINGVTAVEHIFAQLKPHFDQIIVSSNNIEQHSFEGAEVVEDQVKGCGPLMGIASALKKSRHRVNFIIACDIPEVDMNLVRQLIRECGGFDAVIPQTGPSHYEPLFAIYTKDLLASIDESISLGKYKILEPLKKHKVKYLQTPDALTLKNLNTADEYLDFIENTKDAANGFPPSRE